MVAMLDDLLKLNGVVAAGEFTPDGKLVAYQAKMDMSPELAAMTAQFCATVTMMFHTLAGAFTQLSQMKWVPQQGWAYSGGDWTVTIGGKLSMAGASRRGEGSGDVDGRAFMVTLSGGQVTRRRPWPGPDRTPPSGGHKGPNPSQLLSRPYARPVAWPFSFLPSP